MPQVTSNLRRRALLASLALLFLGACREQAEAAGDLILPTKIAFIDEAEPEEVAEGALLAAEEARRAASLVGRDVVIERLRARTPDEVEQGARAAVRGGAVVLIGGFDDESCARLSRVARERRVLWLNVGCRAAAFRDTAAHPRAFHVVGSEAMYQDDAHAVVHWHPQLARSGAAKLNQRYARRFGRPMDHAAWRGWMAVKAVSDAMLRLQTTDPDALAAHFVDHRTAFNGHTGAPLRFRGADHQLQPPAAVGAGTPDEAASGDGAPAPRATAVRAVVMERATR